MSYNQLIKHINNIVKTELVGITKAGKMTNSQKSRHLTILSQLRNCHFCVKNMHIEEILTWYDYSNFPVIGQI